MTGDVYGNMDILTYTMSNQYDVEGGLGEGP